MPFWRNVALPMTSDTAQIRAAAMRRGWLLPGVTFSLVLGIVLSRWAHAPLVLALACLSALVSVFLLRRWRRFAACLLFFCTLGTFLGFQAAHPTLPPEGEALVTGVIAEEITLGENGQVRTILRNVTLNGTPVSSGAYWTYYLSGGESVPDFLQPGAHISLSARVYHPGQQENPDGFDFRSYLLQKDITFGLYGATSLALDTSGRFSAVGTMAAIRHRLSQALIRVCGERSGQLASAVLLGQRSIMSEASQESFRSLGIAHILSVSGYHVGVMAGLLTLLTHPIRRFRKTRTLLTLLLLLLYAFLTGGSAPALRAVLLWGFLQWGHLRNRAVLSLHVLCASAVVQLLFAPLQLFSASFQMTYGAMAALLGIWPTIQRSLNRLPHAVKTVLETAGVSATAQFGVLLPELYWFGSIPALSIVANTLLFLLMNVLLAAYYLTLFCLPIPFLSTLTGRVAGILGTTFLNLLAFLQQFSFSLWTRRPDALVCIGFALIFVSLLPFWRPGSRVRRLFIPGMVLMATLFFPAPFQDTAYIQFSVGNADAAILRQQDFVAVIDTGEDGGDLASYLQANRLSVNLLVLSHLHSDHAGGLKDLLESDIPIAQCILPSGALDMEIADEIRGLILSLEESGTTITFVAQGDVISWPNGQMSVLWPTEGFTSSDPNDGSLALLVETDGVSLLLTGDLTPTYGQFASVPTDILKAAHHGSQNGTTAEFLALSDPDVILVSSGQTQAADRLRTLTDAPVYNTEESGALTIRIRQGTYTVEPFRKEP